MADGRTSAGDAACRAMSGVWPRPWPERTVRAPRFCRCFSRSVADRDLSAASGRDTPGKPV